MTEPASTQSLIHALATQLAPVRPLRSPATRLLGWCTGLVLLVGVLVWHFGDRAMLARWTAAPDLAWAAAGAAGTALTATWAVFCLGVPGYSPRWSWAPLPFALLWIGASGLGCLRTWVTPGTQIGALGETTHCLVFILAFSVPLSAALVWLLRRAYPMRPTRAAMMIGLSSAATSAALLQIFHEFDAAATDLSVHAFAVLLVIGINVLCSGRLLQRV